MVVDPEFVETPFPLVLLPMGWLEGPTEELEDSVITVVTSETTVVPDVPGALEFPIGWFDGAELPSELLLGRPGTTDAYKPPAFALLVVVLLAVGLSPDRPTTAPTTTIMATTIKITRGEGRCTNPSFMLLSRAGVNAGLISKGLLERPFRADERQGDKYQALLFGRIRRTSLTRHTEHRTVTDFSLRDSSTIRPPQHGQCSSGFIWKIHKLSPAWDN